MKKIILLLLSIYGININAAPLFTSAEITRVWGGYPDKAIAFKPVGEVENPAGCTAAGDTAYFMQADHDTKAALSILLAAKASNSKVYFSIRDDICHTIQQVGTADTTHPVIQRIAID